VFPNKDALSKIQKVKGINKSPKKEKLLWNNRKSGSVIIEGESKSRPHPQLWF